jgi:hypothetical protein
MRKRMGIAALIVLSSIVALAAAPQGRNGGHDRGRHEGWAKHHDQDRDSHRDWDFEQQRVMVGHAYPRGRFVGVGRSFGFRAADLHARRVILSDRSMWIVAPYDIDSCRDWEWDRDRVVVYDDDLHPGWYVLLNTRLGRHIHVEYFGIG